MKLLRKYLAIVAVFSLFFTSCTKDEEGTLNNDPGSESFAELSLGATLNDFVNRAAVKQSIPDCSSDAPAYAHIELTHNSGTDLEGIINVNVPILSEDGSFYTDYDEDLKIPVANADDKTATVSVTTFLVYDGDPEDAGSTVIWAAPTTTSDYGTFVNQGLPYNFLIRAGSKKYVDIEVLCFDNRDVNLYGYQFFDLVPEVLHEVCIFANYCDEDGRHYTANYSLEVIYTGGDEDRTLYESMDLPEGSYGFDDDTDVYYADPFCFAVPAPMFEETSGTDYIRIIATLSDWEGNYPTPADEEIILDLSWSDLMESVREDGTIDYFHLFFCDGDPGNGNGEECDPTDPAADCDEDTIPNGQDNCPSTPNTDQADLDEDGVGDVCDSDIDGDDILNENENPGCVRDPDPTCGDDVAECPTLPSAGDCERVYVAGTDLTDLTDWIAITSSEPLALFSDETTSLAFGLISFNDDGDMLLISTNTDFYLKDYKMEIVDELGGAITCVNENNLIAPEDTNDADIETTITGDFSGTVYVRFSANVCSRSDT
ncbi:thrombospondin type 3 repeat-containing protein [Salegentibacter salegens]|uniref:Thrombospondin type 3 repeat-containing protein n=1 Tax=Salegentibacter salegens TaxID=143223 RepID=A0A1M7H8Z0_9FLAO|nr:thrombospondin type 3 repeat-containing protein [Salegentibacter salegens]PRX40934.1 thrombospondin type 3 repeat-containing protein [Salegentibacter salegens]SHM25061.1 Thrombospondin type 3 repeat-containing protein [Salegentibacter salegens]